MSDHQVGFNCPKCDSDQFSIPSDDNEDQSIYCGSCGENVGTKDDVRQKLVEKAKAHAADLVRQAIKGR